MEQMNRRHWPFARPASATIARERKVILALILVFWICFQFLWFAYRDLTRADAPPAGEVITNFLVYVTLPPELTIVAAGALICYAVYALLADLRRRPFWQQLAAAGAAGLVSAALFTIVVSVVCDFFGVQWPALTWRFFAGDTVRWFAPFGLWAGIALAVTYNTEVADRERRLAKVELLAREAQMRALRYQVNPHLLYNTLNSIAALILDGQNEEAEAMVLRLSDFFRASLSNSPDAEVPLIDEVALQRLYVEIEQMRFPEKLESEFVVPAELEQARVPSLILQPLIENSLKHGMHKDGRKTQLRIVAARLPDGRLQIEVSDTGPGTTSAAGTAIGLTNVRERLALRFGDAASVNAQARAGGGFSTQIVMPVQLQ